MCMWIILPITMYSDSCLEGLKWEWHYTFLSYLILSYGLEILLFYLLTDYNQHRWPEGLSRFSRCGYKLMRMYFIFGTAFQSLISRAAEYTAISFMVEIFKCSNDEKLQKEVSLLYLLFAASIFTFMLTILFPFVVFVSLIIKPPKDTFYGITAHTCRLLVWSDLKLLSKYIERHAINYYGPLLWYDQPTYIALSWIKLIFEDMWEFIVQLIFILFIRKQKDERIKDDIRTIQIVFLSLFFTWTSIFSSFLTIYFKQTSQLSSDNLIWVKNNILINGLDQDSKVLEKVQSHPISKENNNRKCKFASNT